MSKLLSRKFWLLAITYIAFTALFIVGKMPVSWFCLSILGMTAFYYIANVWEKQIEQMDINDIMDLIDEIKGDAK